MPVATPILTANTASGSRFGVDVVDWLADPALAGYALSAIDYYGADDAAGTNDTALVETSTTPWKERLWKFYRVECTATKSGSPDITTSSPRVMWNSVVPTAWHGLGGEASWISFSNVADHTVEQVTGDFYLGGGSPLLTADTTDGGERALNPLSGVYYTQEGGMNNVPARQDRICLSFWFKWVANSGSQPTWCGTSEGVSGVSNGETRTPYDIASQSTNSGWYCGRQSGGTRFVQAQGGAPATPFNTWHHAVAEYHTGAASQSMRWYFNGTWFNCSETSSGYLGYLENVNGKPWILNVGGNYWQSIYANAWFDDVRMFINEPMNRSHFNALYRGRGYNGPIGLTEMAFRSSYNYVANPRGCSFVSGANGYETRNGWGVNSAWSRSNRSSTVDNRLAGYMYTPTDNNYFRYDLPYGPGTYKVYAGMHEPGGVTKTGFAFKDGVGGTTLHTMSQSSTSVTSEHCVDINDDYHSSADFFTNQTGVELTFTSDHLALTRQLSLNPGGSTNNGAISWLAIEPVAASSFNPAWAQPATNSIVGNFSC